MKKSPILIFCGLAIIAFLILYFVKNLRLFTPDAFQTTAPELQKTKDQAIRSLKGEIIYIESPKPEEKISSPLVVTGRARGPWFFEASFPLVLTDWDGRIIAQSYAQAQGEWMTTEYVPFEGTLVFENPSWDAEFSKRGSLILKKDNPSGLPEYDDAIEFTVYFQ